MKIIHLIDSLRSGGAERQLVETLKFFQKGTDIISEVVVFDDDIHYNYIEELDIQIYIIKRKSKQDLSVFYKLYKLFKQTKPDIVHSWLSMSSVYAVPSVKLLKIKFVNNFLRTSPLHQSLKDKNWRRAIMTFPFSDVIAANSHAGLDSYRVPHKKRACLHNGFDFNRLENLKAKEMIRSLYDIQTDYVVGMVASFSEKKDYSIFIRAANLILEERNDVTFVAVGDGDYFESIRQQILPNFKDRIKLLGNQKRILNIVNFFDVGVLFTNVRKHGEGIPNAVMEYMALKKPVIVTDCGGNRELVENGITGFLVKPGRPDQIKEKLSVLLNNESLSDSMGQNGYEKLKNEFNLDVMGKEFLNLYNSLNK